MKLFGTSPPSATLSPSDTSRTLQTRDWLVHYHEAGRGRPVILLHGGEPGATAWNSFSSNFAFLASHFHVLAPDMPGWGESEMVSWDRRDHVQVVHQFMESLNLDHAALVGISMGAETAVRMAVRFPDRVSHVVTVGAATAPSAEVDTYASNVDLGSNIFVDACKNPTLESMKKIARVMTFESSEALEDMSLGRALSAQSHPEHLANVLEALSQGRTSRDSCSMQELATLEVPTLLVHGLDDRVVPGEHSMHLLAHIPNSRLVIFNRCGHWAHVEHADEFNHLVKGLVDTK